MKWCYKTHVVFILTLLFSFGNNEKISSLLQNQRFPGRHSLQFLKYSFSSDPNNGNLAAGLKSLKNQGQFNNALSVGWSRLVTTIENNLGQIFEKIIEYEISLQSTHDLYSAAPYRIYEHTTKNRIIKEKVFCVCDPGPCYDHKIFTLKINPLKNTFAIKPNIQALRNILEHFKPLNPAVQAFIDSILNANLPKDQQNLSSKFISLIQNYLAIDNENVELIPYPQDEEDFVIFTDSNNIVHCFSKSGLNIRPVNCPADVLSIREIDFEDGTVMPVKYVDTNGNVHCFDLTNNALKESVCLLDTSILPVVNIMKYVNENGVTRCSVKTGHKLINIACPSVLVNMPVSSTPHGPFQYIDNQGNVLCAKSNDFDFIKIPCPRDTSLLPVYNPPYGKKSSISVKYVDMNGVVHCFEIIDSEFEETKCTSDSSLFAILPSINIEKYLDNNGVEQCRYSFENIISIKSCPKKKLINFVPSMENHSPTVGMNLVKYTTQNRVHCYLKYSTLHPVECPLDTTNIPEISLEDGTTILMKYVDNNDRVHCFDLAENEVKERRCPLDTSLLPMLNIVKYFDDNEMEYCSYKIESFMLISVCPKQAAIPTTSMEDLTNGKFKYIDLQGNVHCSLLNEISFSEIVCPKDTSHLPSYNPIKNLVQYSDSNGEYCFKKQGVDLTPIPCPPIDKSLIPVYSLDSDIVLAVKYIDSNGLVHCFDLSDSDLKEKTCPADISALPMVDIIKYLDDKGEEYCSFSIGRTLSHFLCLDTISAIPLTPIENLQNAVVKYVDPMGRIHCYLKNKFEFSETICPQNTDILPNFNPYKKYLKYVDANNNVYCFYKSGTMVEPTACPDDLSKVADILLSDHDLPIKYIDSNGLIHCYSLSERNLKERNCPADVNLLPMKNIVKFVDDYGVEHCFLKVGHVNKHIHCPTGMNNLLLTSIDNINDIVVKSTDQKGLIHCYLLNEIGFTETVCPKDTSHLPSYNPIKNLVQYSDSNGEYCFKKQEVDLTPIPCPPIDKSLIPVYSLDSDITLAVKYIDSNGLVHCFDLSDYDLKERTCPADISALPMVDIIKYLDDKGKEYCSFSFGKTLSHFLCLNTISEIPLTPIENLQNAVVKYVDPMGRIHCYLKNKFEFSNTICPQNTDILPNFNPYKNYLKYVDANNNVYCFYKSGTMVEPTACPDDLSKVVDILLSDHDLPIKYIDSSGLIHCYSLSERNLKERNCPADVNLLPMKNIVKFVDDYGVEHCFLKVGHVNKHIHCPTGMNNLLLTSIDDINDIVVKSTDQKGLVHCYKITKINFENIICPEDTSLLPEVNPFKNHKPDIKFVPEFTLTNQLPSLSVLKDLNGNNFCYETSGKQAVPVICPPDLSRLPPFKLSDGQYILATTRDKTRSHCYKVYEKYMQIIKCPRDISKLPEVMPLSVYDGQVVPPYGMGPGNSSPLMNLIFGLNKGKDLGNFSPNGSGEVKLNYNELVRVSKLLCKDNHM